MLRKDPWVYRQSYEAAYAVAGKDNAGSIFCDVFDNTIPSTLDFSELDENGYSIYRINGEQMVCSTVILTKWATS
jgi:hypothetical protein